MTDVIIAVLVFLLFFFVCAGVAILLDNWEHLVPSFVKVMPVDYKAVLQKRRAQMRPQPGLRVVQGGQ